MIASRFSALLVVFFLISSCSDKLTKKVGVRKPPADKPYLVRNNIIVKGGQFTGDERKAVQQRLSNQLEDSSKVTRKTSFFITKVDRPPVYDTGYSAASARNMRGSMLHLGYYNAEVTFDADTFQRQVTVNYTVNAGKPTRIDTITYNLRRADLQAIADSSLDESRLAIDSPITKTGVLTEMSRLVDSFRNNGYYKFSAAELRVRGDTSIEALTSVTDDPFEQLRILNEVQQKRDSPEIRLAIVLNKPDDTTKLNKYYINNIYVLPDFEADDNLSDTTTIIQRRTPEFILRYHRKLFADAIFKRTIPLRKGDLFRQYRYVETISRLTALGVWQNVNIRIVENLDEINKVDLVIELIPGKKLTGEAGIEGSYSAVSNTSTALGGNLFGFSTNFSITNRNFAKEAIRMTHNFRFGVEFNNRSRNNATNLINSNEISYTNNLTIPRLLILQKRFPNGGETFSNLGLSYNNRLNLFSLQSATANFGQTVRLEKERRLTFKLNSEFTYLFNQSDSFKRIIDSNLFLRYSYNTAFILGFAASYSSIYRNPRHPLSLARERVFRANFEESGNTIGLLPILRRYRYRYVKLDAEYKYTVSYPKTAIALRAFAGVGIPFGKDSTNRSLPFFKQYFGGGSNSMRGWPVRGIGRGGQKLIPFRNNIFNDRTGDMQIELNGEYRHDIARLFSDILLLKGAVFADVGNIWNLKSTTAAGIEDPAQFKFKNLYKQLGLSAGYGLRFDFNYITVRTDFGFRFKRPERSDINAGWKVPSLTFGDFFPKLFARRFRAWRYENFNFTVGINYPF